MVNRIVRLPPVGEVSVSNLYYRDNIKYITTRIFVVSTGLKLSHLVKTEKISMNPQGLLVIASGYPWNGASGPTFDSKKSKRASLVHDALYELMRKGLISEDLKPQIDALFLKMLKQDGMWFIRARIWYRGVQGFGWMGLGEPRKELVAP